MRAAVFGPQTPAGNARRLVSLDAQHREDLEELVCDDIHLRREEVQIGDVGTGGVPLVPFASDSHGIEPVSSEQSRKYRMNSPVIRNSTSNPEVTFD